MTESGLSRSGARIIYLAKGSRVFVSGMISIFIPYYLNAIGYDRLFVSFALVAILAGNAISNLGLTYFETRLGRRRFLQTFSLLMLAAGVTLAATRNPAAILLACLLGNISTTGTEAGPFQSIEAGVLPDLGNGMATVKAFGTYNFVGYVASSVGAFTAGTPGFLGNTTPVFQGLFLAFGAVGLLLFLLYSRLDALDSKDQGRSIPVQPNLSPSSRREVTRLSALFSVDAFGGSFVSQYVLSYWFLQTYSVSGQELAGIFFITNVIAAASIYGAALIAVRFGNLRTMFFTHVASNVFLVLIPFAGSLVGALVFLFLRQSVSQMDVPTRQALMTDMFPSDERVAVYAVTNTTRSGGAFVGGPVTSALYAFGLLSGPILVGGFSKLVYDFAVYGSYRRKFR